jgi:hypothetical protein
VKKARKKSEDTETEAASEPPANSIEDIHELAKELAAKEVPELPVLIVDDITQESLGQVLFEQGGQLLIASAEATLFDLMDGRYSGRLDIDVLLKGHDGDDLRVNRLGRPPVYVSKPALSIAVVMQPCVINGLAANGMMRGRGLLARPLWILPESMVGCRQIKAQPVPDDILERYNDVTRKIWSKEPRCGQDGLLLPQTLRFSPEADQAMADFEAWLEPQLGDEGELVYIRDWCCKLAGEAARIALILHMAEGTAQGDRFSAIISEATVRKAIRLARDYLLPHALAAFDLMGADPIVEEAKLLLHALQGFECCESFEDASGPSPTAAEGRSSGGFECCGRFECREISRRDLHQRVRTRSRFRTVASLDAPLKLLIEYGYLREKKNEGKSGKGGRPPSPVYEINPLWKPVPDTQNVHYIQNPLMTGQRDPASETTPCTQNIHNTRNPPHGPEIDSAADNQERTQNTHSTQESEGEEGECDSLV